MAGEDTTKQIGVLRQRCHSVIENLRDSVFQPQSRKQLERRFTITEAATMVGRSTTAIRDAEADGRLPMPEVGANGRRQPYKLEDVNRMRDAFGSRLWKAPGETGIAIAIQNFKGGVGKSTIACHFAQFMALRGYRVLVIDADSQASTTSMFGLLPDYDVDADETLRPFLAGEIDDPRAIVRTTYWPGIDLVPANLRLYDSEYEIAAQLGSNRLLLDRLRLLVDLLRYEYDVVIMDPPPALGMISLSVVRAADALLVPIPPSILDFTSSIHFLDMLAETLTALDRIGLGRDYAFVRMVISKANENKSAHTIITRTMQEVFGSHLLRNVLKDSAAIDTAAAHLRTLYELQTPLSASRETHERALRALDAVFGEIEVEIRKLWPSHAAALARDALA